MRALIAISVTIVLSGCAEIKRGVRTRVISITLTRNQGGSLWG
jgi:hypothetical protein